MDHQELRQDGSSGDEKKLAELARPGLLLRAGHVEEAPVRELRELVSAPQQLKSKRVVLINTIRGYVYQEGHRLLEKSFTRSIWAAKLARLPVSAPLKLIPDVHDKHRGADIFGKVTVFRRRFRCRSRLPW